jgi:hypothetical protein
MDFDREKFKAVVHYIIWKAGSHHKFGATKLNKVLWFADARLYMLTGRPISGATYTRQKWGPVPKQIMPVRSELAREGAISIIDSRGDGDNTKFKALTSPDISMLSEKEKQVLDYWIDHIDKDHTAASISEQSHDYGWEIAEMGEELPLAAFMASRIRSPNEIESEEIRKRAKELGLI